MWIRRGLEVNHFPKGFRGVLKEDKAEDHWVSCVSQ